MNRGANYSSDPDLINLITLTKKTHTEAPLAQRDDLDEDEEAKKKTTTTTKAGQTLVAFFSLSSSFKLMFCYTFEQQLLTSRTKCV
jgi:hypothetical protein